MSTHQRQIDELREAMEALVDLVREVVESLAQTSTELTRLQRQVAGLNDRLRRLEGDRAKSLIEPNAVGRVGAFADDKSDPRR